MDLVIKLLFLMEVKEHEKRLEELLHYLECVHLDENEKYVVKVSDGNGNYNEILNRERYLEFVIESMINDVSFLISEVEE